MLVEEANVQKLQARITNEPEFFHEEVLGYSPWERQLEISRSIRDHRNTAVRSCNGAGKTFHIAHEGLRFLFAYYPAVVLNTAPVWTQVENQYSRYFRDAYNKAQYRLGGKLLKTQLNIGENWFAMGLANDPDRMEAFQGWHAENIMVIFDEASGITSITKAVSKTDLYDMDQEISLMVDAVTPILSGLLTEQMVREWEAQGFAGTLNSGSELVRKTVNLAAKRLAKSYNDTTAKLLKSALNDGLQAGEGLPDLTKRVQQVYEFSDAVRAKAVAHTESFYIANKANKLAYQESGVVKTIRWYTSEAENVCEFCAPLHGRTIGVQEDFFQKGDTYQGRDGGIIKLDYRTVGEPPIHVNCNCFLRPEEISID